MTTPLLPTPYFQRDGVTLYLGDSAQIAPMLPHFDLMLTDPPYGLNIAKGGKLGSSKLRYPKQHWDKSAPAPWLLDSLRAKANSQIIWGGNYFGLPGSKGWLVWNKQTPRGMSFADCELAWTNLPTVARVFTWSWVRDRSAAEKVKVHITQKPLALIQWCMDLAGDVRSVFDPFAGSGTTLLSALSRGITAVGCDLDEHNCEEAAKRLQAA